MSTRTRALILAGALLTGSAMLPAALTPALAQAQKSAAASFTDAQLDQFATAAIDIYRINNKHVERWRAAAVPAEKTKIQAEAKVEQEAAIRKSGLSLQTYNQILTASKADPALNERIADRIKAKTPS